MQNYNITPPVVSINDSFTTSVVWWIYMERLFFFCGVDVTVGTSCEFREGLTELWEVASKMTLALNQSRMNDKATFCTTS